MRSDFNNDNNNNLEHRINLFKQKYQTHALTSSQRKGKAKHSSKDQFKKLKELAGREYGLLETLKDAVKKYADQNLNQVGTGNTYSTDEMNIRNSTEIAKAKNTSKDREKAVNLLFDVVKVSSAHEVYEYVTMPAFQQLTGAKDSLLNPFKNNLANAIKNFTNNYKTFLDSSNNEILLNVLLDETLMANIAPEDLSQLFWSYNSKLIADVIVNFYEHKTFAYYELTYDFFKRLLDDDVTIIEYVNNQKSQRYASLILPADAIKPGKNPLANDEMTKFESFQYDDLTIYAVEQWLRGKFKHLLVNNIHGIPDYENKSETAPYLFYQIPSAPYMLVDPKHYTDSNYYRYKSFRQQLRSLLDSYDPIENPLNKPILFCCVLNYKATHYVAIIIHKTKRDTYQIITVDPSPQIYPATAKEKDGSFTDGKLRARAKIAEIFADIFPGKCEVFDPDVAQMLKEHDCGPNSATTLFDALRTCLDKNPLLVIENDNLQINPERLTIHHQPVGFNFYTGTYVYSSKLEAETQKNRDFWRNELVNVTKVSPLTIRRNPHQPLTIEDCYDVKDQIEIDYSYIDQVETQDHQDRREINISAVQSLLLSSEEGQAIRDRLINEYKQTLRLPDAVIVVNFVKTKVSSVDELSDLMSEHNNSLEELANDVMGIVLRDHIASALITVFDTNVLSKLPTSLNLVAEDLIDKFLEENKIIFQKLSIYQQRIGKNVLLENANKVVDQKLITCHLQRIENYLKENCRLILAKIDTEVKNNALVNAAIDVIFNDNNAKVQEIRESIDFLTAKSAEELNKLFTSFIEQTFKKVIDNSVDKICATFKVNEKTLTEILIYFSKDNGRFHAISEKDLMNALMRLDYTLASKDKNTQILLYTEIYSILAKKVLIEVNKKLHASLYDRINDCIQVSVKEFLSQQNFQQQFLVNQEPSYLSSLLDNQWRLLSDTFGQDVLKQILSAFGNKASLSKADFSHYQANKLATQCLLEGIANIIRKNIEDFFEKMAASIFTNDANKGLLSNYDQYMQLNNIHAFACSLYENYYCKNFLENFLLTDAGQVTDFNPFGKRFDQWFKTKKLEIIFKNISEIKALKNNIANSLALMDKLKEVLADKINLIPGLEEFYTFLFSHYNQLNNITLVNNFQETYESYKREYCQKTESFLRNNLYAQYKPGDIVPGSLSSLIRPILCAWLDIDTPYILTKNHTKKLDEKIKQKLYQEISLGLNVRANTHLLFLKPLAALENNYGKPITRQLLIDCVSFWFSQATFAYDLSHPEYWFEDGNLPPLVKTLLEIVNFFPEGEEAREEEIISGNLPDLDRINSNMANELTIYNSTDLVNQIKSALAKTSTLSNTKPTTLHYLSILKHLAMKLPPVVETDDNNSAPAVEMTGEMIQQKVMEKIRELRDQNKHAQINISKIRAEVTKELQGSVAKKKEALTIEPINVQSRELKMKNGLLSNFSLLGGGLTNIEKKLILLQSRHDNNTDFYLDKRDVQQFGILIKHRWDKLKEHESEDSAARRYTENPTRKDKIYIACAEILSLYYRKKNKMVYPYELLMPGYKRFPKAEGYIKEEAHVLPNICEQHDFVPSETSIADIPIANLVITRSRYALDITWIINVYKKTENLIHPYTQKPLTDEELEDISHNSKFIEIVSFIQSKTCNSITERGVQLLVDYLNGAIFTEGFTKMYTEEQNKTVYDTCSALAQKPLPQTEGKALANETIPGEDATVDQIFKKSMDSCLTLKGVSLAKVVIAYKGDNHGLKNEELVKRAKEELKKVNRYQRKYNFNPNKDFNLNSLDPKERYIMSLAERRGLKVSGKRPTPR